MTIDIKRTVGRPKKLPDIMPQLEAAIKEWEGEEPGVAVTAAVNATISHGFFPTDKVSAIFWRISEFGMMVLIWLVVFYVMRRI